MPEWDGWVGKRFEARSTIEEGPANRLAVTMDREPTYGRGDLLPPGWHWLYFNELIRASQLGNDGHARPGLIMPPVGLPRRMWASGRLDFRRPISIGSNIVRSTRIESITPKIGRTGELCFVVLRHELRDDEGPCIDEEQTIVYRAANSEREGLPPGASDTGLVRAEWHLDSTMLFRYSALTFNGHRIHYDVEYCRSVEQYPGLVVQGPLVATLILDAVSQAGRNVGSFTYRSTQPLFAPAALRVLESGTDGELSLRAADADGRVVMEATAAVA